MYGNYNNIARAPFIKSAHFDQFILQRKKQRKNLEKNSLVCRNLGTFVRETEITCFWLHANKTQHGLGVSYSVIYIMANHIQSKNVCFTNILTTKI